MSGEKAGSKQSAKAEERTLDDNMSTDAQGALVPSIVCTPEVCQLGDKVGKWGDQKNYECPRCDFATVDEQTARDRNPKHFARS